MRRNTEFKYHTAYTAESRFIDSNADGRELLCTYVHVFLIYILTQVVIFKFALIEPSVFSK